MAQFHVCGEWGHRSLGGPGEGHPQLHLLQVCLLQLHSDQRFKISQIFLRSEPWLSKQVVNPVYSSRQILGWGLSGCSLVEIKTKGEQPFVVRAPSTLE